jgi:hypothetical protein
VTKMVISKEASLSLSQSATHLASSLTQAASTTGATNVQVTFFHQSSVDAVVPAGLSAEQVAAAMQISLCGSVESPGCTVTVGSTNGRRKLQSETSFTISQEVLLSDETPVSDLLVAPVLNVSEVSSQLFVDPSELSIGTSTVQGLVATVSVEQTGPPVADGEGGLDVIAATAALGIDPVEVVYSTQTITPPAPPPSFPPSPPSPPPPSPPPPPPPSSPPPSPPSPSPPPTFLRQRVKEWWKAGSCCDMSECALEVSVMPDNTLRLGASDDAMTTVSFDRNDVENWWNVNSCCHDSECTLEMTLLADVWAVSLDAKIGLPVATSAGVFQ